MISQELLKLTVKFGPYLMAEFGGHGQRSAYTNMKNFHIADRDADTFIKNFQTADTDSDMIFSKNHRHGHVTNITTADMRVHRSLIYGQFYTYF